MCHMSRVAGNLSYATCYRSLVTKPIATATDPPPAKPPTMHRMLVCEDPKTPKKVPN